jgi:hypothetical protein
MTDAIQRQIDLVNWSDYETAYGPAVEVPRQLRRLFSGDSADSRLACHELWCALCHQHVPSSAALPALPVLLHALNMPDTRLIAGILDMLYGFSAHTAATPIEQLPPWQRDLRLRLFAEAPTLLALRSHSSKHVSGWADMICDELGLHGSGD